MSDVSGTWTDHPTRPGNAYLAAPDDGGNPNTVPSAASGQGCGTVDAPTNQE